ncbi:MAG: exonuclease SbcCD subunit D C-terminal domain-containing protein [Tannerella sp.]|jgi:exonuclease SbcD|nr:exonuclease SbcCD subunit D C-terminal domain-containing protein [Tannerella sp.]
MKIIHTADWHLGQNFYEYDRKAEHACFLTWLKKTVAENRADVLLIAGDVFDSPNPSAESQKMYFSFLREITNENPDLQIVIIAGNHDSAARLEAPNPLLEDMNITVRGIIRRSDSGEIDYEHLIIPLNKGGYCLAVPYLRQGDYPEAGNYSQSVKALYDKLYETAGRKIAGNGRDFQPVIAMGHLQATGSEISENDRSERTVIGGLECVSPEAFSENIAYTALGHLHRGQRVSGRENVRYSGTPIPMSFAEKNNRQGVVLIEISPADPVNIKRIIFEDAVTLISIPQEPMPPDDVLRKIKELPEGEITAHSPYLELKVHITEPEPSMRHRIEEELKGKTVRLARISAVMQGNKKESNVMALEDLQATNPADIAEKIFEQQYGGEKMPEAMKKLLHEVIQEVER